CAKDSRGSGFDSW
nr:immunoglobulin heavy chain junction region [Macaca mulatta]MOX91893.1 immunoglobulin heavy chain junction region [Macaca mulatta]MOX92143.1 immunoglobulin heavy chain junction region [Macaca mulatta]MOX92188.1 immunoglobulin heavy chain junction region [Macaca mulatta]MOX92636.1 immunoglobulin heavy chain junction region [Macaca mulatta]